MENGQYLQAFLDESFENTQLLNSICLKMEQTKPSDDDFAAMFRAAHTLKGMSATMGFTHMANLTHRLEDALGHLRQHPEQLTPDAVDLFFAAIDALEQDLRLLQSDTQAALEDHSPLADRLAAVTTGVLPSPQANSAGASPLELVDDTVAMIIAESERMGLAVGVLTAQLDPGCQMKGPRAVMVSRVLQEYGEILSCSPPVDVMETGVFAETALHFLVALEHDVEACLQEVRNIAEIVDAVFLPYKDWQANTVGGGEVAAAATSVDTEAVRPSADGTSARPERMDRTIRVPVERLDTLMNYLSELVIDKTRLSEFAKSSTDAQLKELADHLSRIATDLQASVMSMRMVPVATLFQRFPRMVRDLSKSLGKDIRLELSGTDTELDRTVIDEMGEVLVHLIRNSADHGLEDPETRAASGKSVTGTISLRAYSSGQSVFIEVADDGGGIDEDKVRRRAVERGLLDASQAASLTSREVYELLFASGFSTADQVSDISGRGVGLDAVRDKVQALGGNIDIDSQPGVGTVFRVQLPLTLSILRALLFAVDGDTFAIPLNSVDTVVHATQANLAVVQGKTVLNVHDQVVPVLDLGDWFFGRPSGSTLPWKVVICKEGNRRIGVVVNRFMGQQEIVHKSLGTYLQSPWFAGATILGDGRIALILDVHALVRQLL